MTVALALDASVIYERFDFFGSPDGSARAKFDWFGKASSAATFPPCAFADGNDGKDLG